VKRYRGKENVTLSDVTHKDVTLIAHTGVTLLHRPNGADYDPEEKLYNSQYYNEGTPRYLVPLSDGQVLDRLSV